MHTNQTSAVINPSLSYAGVTVQVLEFDLCEHWDAHREICFCFTKGLRGSPTSERQALKRAFAIERAMSGRPWLWIVEPENASRCKLVQTSDMSSHYQVWLDVR